MPFSYFDTDDISFQTVLVKIVTFSPNSNIFMITRKSGHLAAGELHNILNKYYGKNSPNVLIFRIMGGFYDLLIENGEFDVEEFHDEGVRDMPFIIQEAPLDDVSMTIEINIVAGIVQFSVPEQRVPIWRDSIEKFLNQYITVSQEQVDPNTIKLD
jgi:hypothetical protein